MNKEEKEKLSMAMYHIVISIKDNVTLPTHGTIAKVLVFAIAMLMCSLISTLLHFYTFVSWQGCLICIAMLLILLWVERAENDTLVKAYKAGQAYAKRAESLVKGRQVPTHNKTKKGEKKNEDA